MPIPKIVVWTKSGKAKSENRRGAKQALESQTLEGGPPDKPIGKSGSLLGLLNSNWRGQNRLRHLDGIENSIKRTPRMELVLGDRRFATQHSSRICRRPGRVGTDFALFGRHRKRNPSIDA